jgi:hypothetical protein
MAPSELVSTLAGLLLGAASFYIGRMSAAKNEGATLAKIEKDIEFLVKQMAIVQEALEKQNSKYDDSIRRLHDRINEHERLYHQKEA